MSKDNLKNFGGPMSLTVKKIQLVYNRAFKQAGLNITADQMRVLIVLNEKNGLSQTELADGSAKNAPTLSRIIDLLCNKGLTERQRFANDRRRYKVFLTNKGKQIVKQALPIVQQLRANGWQGLNNNDFQHFIKVINQLNKNFENML